MLGGAAKVEPPRCVRYTRRASRVRTPGQDAVLRPEEVRLLLDSIDTSAAALGKEPNTERIIDARLADMILRFSDDFGRVAVDAPALIFWATESASSRARTPTAGRSRGRRYAAGCGRRLL